MEVTFSSRSQKDIRKVSKSNKDLHKILDQVVTTLRDGGELDKKYSFHKLDGIFQGYYNIHLKPDLVLVASWDKNNGSMEVLRVGTHANIIENRRWSPR